MVFRCAFVIATLNSGFLVLFSTFFWMLVLVAITTIDKCQSNILIFAILNEKQ